MSGIQSMTGYGRSSRRTPLGTVTVELRSTNHRFLELEPRLPNGLASLQGRLTELLRTAIRRGRVEATVTLQAPRGSQRRVAFDEPLLSRYHEALLGLKNRFGLKGAVTLDHLLALPQALAVFDEGLPIEQAWTAIREPAQAALKDLVHARRREGAKLADDLRRQVAAIERCRQRVKRRLPQALKRQRQQLRRRLPELLRPHVKLSSSQLEQAAAFARETDIHEELVRLDSHLTYIRHALATEPLVGKRLDFIAQELVREANTIGSKVDDPHAAHEVVEMKSCVEKIREQVQNLE